MSAPVCVAAPTTSPSRSGKSPGHTTFRLSRMCSWRARCMQPLRLTRRSRSSTTMRSPKSLAMSWGSGAILPAGGCKGRRKFALLSGFTGLRLAVRFRHLGARARDSRQFQADGPLPPP